MNCEIRKKTAVCIFAAFCFSAFCQNNSAVSEDEQIILPEVTTTVSGDSLSAGKDALPDFSKIIPAAPSGKDVLPKLPGLVAVTAEEEPVADLGEDSVRSVYAQGLIGCGFPGYFKGDFSIYKSSGDEPFMLKFLHESENGYGLNSAGDGYFDANTALFGEKTLSFDKITLDLNAGYETLTYGLQGKSPFFYDLNHRFFSTDNKFAWKIGHGFGLDFKLAGSFYSRYAGVPDIEIATEKLPVRSESADVFYLNPGARFFWQGKYFSAGLSAAYDFESAFGESNYSSQSVNRGVFILDADWKNSFLSAGAGGGVVVGTSIGENSVVPVFDISFGAKWMTALSKRPLELSLAGGIKSSHSTYAQSEREYAYSAADSLDSETTDWFADFKAAVPVSSVLNLDLLAQFKKTAFGNGAREADYSSESEWGLYSFEKNERTLFTTEVSLSYVWKTFNFSAGWNSHWMHVPSNEYANSVKADISFQSQNGIWGFSAALEEFLGEGSDVVPVIGGTVFYKIHDSIRLTAELDDLVKLFAGDDRTYFGNKYIKNSGSANISVRFFF